MTPAQLHMQKWVGVFHLGGGMKEVVVVFLGGGVGSAFRYWLSGSVYRFLSPTFPYGTLVVNVSGCFLIGFLMAIFEERFVVQPLLRLFLTLGILGGFTTFSTFSFETVELLREGSMVSGLVNVLVSLGGCLTATALGNMLGRLL
jgi:fluoride exporter